MGFFHVNSGKFKTKNGFTVAKPGQEFFNFGIN